MKRLLVLASLVALLWHSSAAADIYQDQHDWEHVGVSFAVQTVTYGFFKKSMKLKTFDAVLFSMTTTFMLTTLYSLNNNDTTLGRTIGMNMLGAALSVGTCQAFSFGEPAESLADFDKRKGRR